VGGPHRSLSAAAGIAPACLRVSVTHRVMTDMLATPADPEQAPERRTGPAAGADPRRAGHPSTPRGGVTMDVVKQVSKSPGPTGSKVGFPGEAAGRRARIRRAIKANAETLRRLAR
jgi:hypothetical protein